LEESAASFIRIEGEDGNYTASGPPKNNFNFNVVLSSYSSTSVFL
jgi:hypothetical protein